MLSINLENRTIEGTPNEIYENKDHLKFFRCLWDKESKTWRIPFEDVHLKRLSEFISKWNEMQEEVNEKKKDLWKQAQENLNLSFVKKETVEYDLVKEEFKRLIKAN
jgi:hypothetical protein